MTTPSSFPAPSLAPSRSLPGQPAGFTLLEVMVALVVLGFLVVGLSQGTRLGLVAWDRQAARAAERGDLDAVDRLLRRLVQQMDPGGPGAPAATGTATSLAFTADLDGAASALGVRDAEALLLAERGRLVLRWRPYLHARRLAAPPFPRDEVLLDGLAGLDLAYWAPGTEAGPAGWRTEWSGRSLPALVRIRLVFPPGSRRRWPDIIAAPVRERLGR